jgi:hypothetical protein
MSDDIIEGLRGAGEDDGRPLGFGAAEILRAGRSRRRRRRVYGGSATALGVAAMALTAWSVLPSSLDDRSTPATGGEELDTGAVLIDRGPMSQEEVMDEVEGICVDEVEELDTIYARWVDAFDHRQPAFMAVARQPDGPAYTCGASWGFRGTVRLPEVDAAHPIAPFASDEFVTSIDGRWVAESEFYRVDESVARVEARVGTRGGSEPWRAAEIHDGIAFWSAWVEAGAYDADDEVWLQWRAYDTEGNLIDPDLLPDQPRRVHPVKPRQ